MNIYYWSPFITHVATVKAVINSASSLNRYSQKYTTSVINVAGEWNIYKKDLLKKNIKIIDLTSSKIIDNKKVSGFFKSRIIYIYLFLISFFPLIKLLKKNPPNFFIIHLISPLPLILNYFMNFNTKMILRISGLPKLNFFRKILWRITLKKIYSITCPTIATKNDIESVNLIDKNKIQVLYDPIISPKNIKDNLLNNSNLKLKDYYLAIGRLTKQKNFLFLIEVFKKFNQNKNNMLVIIGDGEQKKEILNYIKNNNLQKTVLMFNFTENIFNYYKNSKCFILSSLWEDPGFVIVEAIYMNIPIISSNCKNGPEEILDYGDSGILFENNNKESLLKAFEKFENLTKEETLKFRINAKLKSRQFTLFNHYNRINNLFQSYEPNK